MADQGLWVPTNSWSLFSRQLMLSSNNKVLYRECVFVRNRALWKDKVNLSGLLPPLPPPLDRSLTLSYKGHFLSVWEEIFPAFVSCARLPLSARASLHVFCCFIFPTTIWKTVDVIVLLADSKKCCRISLRVVLIHVALWQNLNPADPGSDINLPEDS